MKYEDELRDKFVNLVNELKSELSKIVVGYENVKFPSNYYGMIPNWICMSTPFDLECDYQYDVIAFNKDLASRFDISNRSADKCYGFVYECFGDEDDPYNDDYTRSTRYGEIELDEHFFDDDRIAALKTSIINNFKTNVANHISQHNVRDAKIKQLEAELAALKLDIILINYQMNNLCIKKLMKSAIKSCLKFQK